MFPAPIILALAANEIRSERRKRTFQTVSYAPHFISTVVVCGMITVFLSPESGVINFLLQVVGIEPVAFLAKPNAFKWVYVLSGIWQTIGWSAIIYIAALSGVDKNLLEAAEIDGANRIQRIRYVNLPVLVPTIVIMFILRCGSILSVGYEKVYLLQNTANLSASEVISTYVYKVGLGVRVITGDGYPWLPEGTFGWSGAYGTHFWVDPVNEIVAVYMKNSRYDGGSGALTGKHFEEDVFSSIL